MPPATPLPAVDQADIVAFLADGAAYDGIVADAAGMAVRRIETHCSVIFLIGDRAFKLKKAVKFSYLDYTDPAAREAFVLAELTLNRRTAPQLYLGRHKIVRTADAKLRLASADASGAALDWILEMRRFPDDALLATLAEEDRLTPALMQDLADAIHRFHEAAEPAPSQGGAVAMRNVMMDALDNLRLQSPPLNLPFIEGLANHCMLPEFASLEVLIDRRQAAGFVRRCHGDLHLGNICLYDGKPLLFDGIEFSDAISCIDTFYDLSFLLMDLCHRDRTDLANIVLNRYLDRNGDIAGLATLPFFLSLRAAIRAHILAGASKTLDDPVLATSKEAASKKDEAIGYLDTARYMLDGRILLSGELMDGSPPLTAPRLIAPQLIAIGGFSGSGKSTYAKALAPRFKPMPGARITRSDSLRKRLMQVAPETRLPPEAYTKETNDRVYAAMMEETATALRAGYTVIVDAAYLRETERHAIAAQAEQLRLPFTGFWLDVPQDVLASRIAARRNDVSDADLAVLRQQLGYDLGHIDWHRIDAAGEPTQTLAAMRAVLGSFRHA